MEHSQQVRAAKRLAYRTLLDRGRFRKYFWFVVALQLYKLITYLAFKPSKGHLLEAFYLVHRYIDDVADGDAKPNFTRDERVRYIKRKKQFTRHPQAPHDEIEHLIHYYREIARKRREDFTAEANGILDSMLFDAQRFGTNRVFSDSSLTYNYHLLDEKGTVRPMLKLFNENPNRFYDLAALANAVRIYYNLRDWETDAQRGLINITAEDCIRYHLGQPVLEHVDPKALRQWFRNQAVKGLELIKAHHQGMEKRPFKYATRLVLWLVYERKARLFLQQIAAA